MKKYHHILSDTCVENGSCIKKCVVKHLWNNNNGTKPQKQEVLGYNGSIQAGIYRFYG